MSAAQLAIVVPLIGAALLAGTTSLDARRLAEAVALAVAAATAVLCLVVLSDSRDGTVVAWFGNWHPRPDGVVLGIDVAADQLGAGLAAFSALLTLVALAVAVRMTDVAGHVFHALVLVFLAATVGFSLAGDLFTLFVFFELLSVAGYALAGHLVDRRAPVEGALGFAVTNTAGSVLLLTGIALLYGRTGALNLAQLGVALAHQGHEPAVILGLALVFTGFFVKAAIVPFHFWLADAYAAAPAAVCVLFAGVMSELGIYAVARVLWTALAPALAGHAGGLRAVLLALGLLTAVWGGVMCVVQRHLKRLLAFATISHMGVLLVAVGLMAPEAIAGAALYVVGDGAVKAGLFVAVGVLDDRYGAIDDVRLFGRGRAAPALGATVALGGLMLAGLPLAGPWLGRTGIEAAADARGYWWIAPVLALAGALTGGAVLRVVRTVFLGRGEAGELDPATERDDPVEPEPSAQSAWAWAPAALLVLFALAWGFLPGLADSASAAAARFVDTAGYARAVLTGATVVGPGAHAEAPALSAYLYGLLGCAGALAVGAAGLPPQRGRGPMAALRAFRHLHSGRVGDYLAWTAAGTAALAAACALALS